MLVTAINITQLWAICIGFEKKHLNGVICTFHSLPHVLQRSHLLSIDLSLRCGAEQGTHCQRVLSLSNKAIARKLKDRQGWKLICVRLWNTLFQCSSVRLLRGGGGVCVALCCSVCAFTPADTVRCRCEWGRPWGHLKTHTHTLTSGLHRPLGCTNRLSAMWLCRTLSGRQTHTHTRTLKHNWQKDTHSEVV